MKHEMTEWEYVTEIAKKPDDQSLYVAYIAWLKESIKETTHWHMKMKRWNKIHFLEAQEAEDFTTMHRKAEHCDPNWLAIVSRPPIVNCGRPDADHYASMQKWWKIAHSSHREKSLDEWIENHPSFRMDFVCSKTWNEMTPTENRKVRFCGDCKKNVYFCDNIMEARELGNQGCCIGVDVGIQRRKNDLVGEFSIFGTPKAETLEQEEQRRMPDRISAKRIMDKLSLQMLGQPSPSPKE